MVSLVYRVMHKDILSFTVTHKYILNDVTLNFFLLDQREFELLLEWIRLVGFSQVP